MAGRRGRKQEMVVNVSEVGAWLEGGEKSGVWDVEKEIRGRVIEAPVQSLQVSSLDISNYISSIEGFHLQYQTLASPGTH